jgi:hypothetical protein
MCLETLAHKRIAHQLVSNLGDQAIEPSFRSQAVPDEIGLHELGFGVADRRREFTRHSNDPCRVPGPHRENDWTIVLRHDLSSLVAALHPAELIRAPRNHSQAPYLGFEHRDVLVTLGERGSDDSGNEAKCLPLFSYERCAFDYAAVL